MTFTFNQLIDRMATCATSITTFGAGGRRTRAFAEMHADVLATARRLHDLGVRRSSRVGVLGRNCYEWAVIDLACVALGAVVVAFDASHQHDLPASIRKYELERMLVGAEHPVASERTHSFAELVGPATATALPPPAIVRDRRPREVVSIKFTSGTTGDNKAMEVEHESVEATIDSVQAMFQHGASDRILLFLPLHLIQQRYWIYSAITFGANVVLCSYELAMGLLRSEKPTVIMGIPGFFETLEKSYRTKTPSEAVTPAHFQAHLGGAVRYLWTGSAGIGRSTLDFYYAMGVKLLQGYGTNESCIVSKNYPGHDKVGSVGPLLPDRELRFDADGQILVRPKHRVAKSYLHVPAEENERVFRPDGFIATGDLGYLDSEGYLYISGRLKEVVVLSSGRKVNPHHVESALKANPDVLHCFVHGSERPHLIALVNVREGSLSPAELDQWVSKVNATLKPEERVYGVASIREPFSVDNGLLSAQLKPRRSKIVEKYAAEIAALYEGPVQP